MRYQALEALNWYGSEAVGEMIPYMEDQNESIAVAAFNFMDEALSMMDEENEKGKLIEVMTVGYVTQEEQLESLLSKLEGVSSDKAVRSLLSMMKKVEEGSVMDAHLREEYESVTGEKFVSSDMARLWIIKNGTSKSRRR